MFFFLKITSFQLKEENKYNKFGGYEPNQIIVSSFSRANLAKEWAIALQDVEVYWTQIELKLFKTLCTSEMVQKISDLQP